jgi:predicted  nucleic acid-binding Zn-ribbon protein
MSADQAGAENDLIALRKEGERMAAEVAKATQMLVLDARKAEKDLEYTYLEADARRRLTLLAEEAKATETRMRALQPSLVEAMVALAQTGQLEAVAEHLAPLAIVRGESLAGTLDQLFRGTPLEGMVHNLESLSKVKKLPTGQS